VFNLCYEFSTGLHPWLYSVAPLELKLTKMPMGTSALPGNKIILDRDMGARTSPFSYATAKEIVALPKCNIKVFFLLEVCC